MLNLKNLCSAINKEQELSNAKTRSMILVLTILEDLQADAKRKIVEGFACV